MRSRDGHGPASHARVARPRQSSIRAPPERACICSPGEPLAGSTKIAPSRSIPIRAIRSKACRFPCWPELLHAAMNLADGLELGYLGVDFVLDAVRGPVVLEANVRPGLNIQVANRRGLMPRLRLISSSSPPIDWPRSAAKNLSPKWPTCRPLFLILRAHSADLLRSFWTDAGARVYRHLPEFSTRSILPDYPRDEHRESETGHGDYSSKSSHFDRRRHGCECDGGRWRDLFSRIRARPERKPFGMRAGNDPAPGHWRLNPTDFAGDGRTVVLLPPLGDLLRIAPGGGFRRNDRCGRLRGNAAGHRVCARCDLLGHRNGRRSLVERLDGNARSAPSSVALLRLADADQSMGPLGRFHCRRSAGFM